uniref:Uncharacterized protein n=1 Tax=Romanomermis culicivorax TaxID=13658 RepID=A0A915JDV0_ROMCU
MSTVFPEETAFFAKNVELLSRKCDFFHAEKLDFLIGPFSVAVIFLRRRKTSTNLGSNGYNFA